MNQKEEGVRLMRILWLVNVPLPEASRLLGKRPTAHGGWLVGLSNVLTLNVDIDLHVAFPLNDPADPTTLKGEKITYYPFKPFKIDDIKRIQNDRYFRELLVSLKPDLVHIHGTEFPHTLAMVDACNEIGVKHVLSIQGLLHILAKHIYSNLPPRVIYGKTLKDILRFDSIRLMRKQFLKRAKHEIGAIQKTQHIIGRTTWDKACVMQINPVAKYYHCNEILRDEFYKHKWDLGKCERYSIFVSQGYYPIKGLHNVIEAMPIILKQFSQAKLYVAGFDPTRSSAKSLRERLSINYYGKYIRDRIKQLGLSGRVIFTGELDEIEMCSRFLKSHVFVSASSLENESNSLSEAKILGVPSVASFVGGVTDRIQHGIDGFFYQHDAPYMLAHYVCEIFKSDETALRLSENARNRALETHNRERILHDIIGIYEKICLEGDMKWR